MSVMEVDGCAPLQFQPTHISPRSANNDRTLLVKWLYSQGLATMICPAPSPSPSAAGRTSIPSDSSGRIPPASSLGGLPSAAAAAGRRTRLRQWWDGGGGVGQRKAVLLLKVAAMRRRPTKEDGALRGDGARGVRRQVGWISGSIREDSSGLDWMNDGPLSYA